MGDLNYVNTLIKITQSVSALFIGNYRARQYVPNLKVLLQ